MVATCRPASTRLPNTPGQPPFTLPSYHCGHHCQDRSHPSGQWTHSCGSLTWRPNLQFNTRNLTKEQTNFNHVLASLTPEFPLNCHLRSYPRTSREECIFYPEKQLIKRMADSEQRQLQLLFNTKELGERKPTQMFH